MPTLERPVDYENIFLEGKQYKSGGKMKLVPGGIGWKEAVTGTIITLKSEEFKRIQWLRAARDYQLRIIMQNDAMFKFDGFGKEAFEFLKEFVKSNYNLPLEQKEVSLKGWNWGKTEIEDNHLQFLVQKKPLFEVPLREVSNATVSAKNEVTIELNQVEGLIQSKKVDSLVDIRFYIPPLAEEETEEDADMDSATQFCTTLKSVADIGAAGIGGAESIVTFQELPFLVPRGRYEADLFASFLRLRGKSYDYKIPYSNILKMFLLPKPDDLHVLFVISLEPPLRQGQTRYPFLILQFPREDEVQVSLTLTNEIKTKFETKLQKEYEGPQYEVVSNLLRTLAEKRVITPGNFKRQEFEYDYHESKCIKTSYKANEGHLYPLEKNFIFLPKPCIFMPHEDIAAFVFSRVDGSLANSRTFDIKISMHGGVDHSFSNINKEELALLEEFLREKRIKFQNELGETTAKKRYVDAVSGSESEDDIAPIKSDGEEEEESSTDEDYQEGDSNASQSSSSSEADEENANE